MSPPRQRDVLVDSHCHLNYLEAPAARLADARRQGVGAFLCIAVDESGLADVVALAESHADVWATVGQHPEGAGADTGGGHGAGDRPWITARLAHPRVVAVGETGLDYFHETDPRARQRQQHAFDDQLGLAVDHDLPVVVHTRAAEDDTRALLRAHPRARGVLHCFTESWSLASAALDRGFYVSISGIVTFRNADNVRDVARRIPDDRLLIETDSPWLAPVPCRGQANEPALLPHTARFLAELRGCTVEELAATTTANFEALFGVSVS